MKLKRLEIKNPLLRGLVGAGIFIPGLAVALVISIIFCYGMGQLTETLYASYNSYSYTSADYDFHASFGWGLSMTALVAVSGSIMFYIIKGCIWVGNRCFKPVVVEN